MERVSALAVLPSRPSSRGVVGVLLNLAALRRQRRHLEALDAHLLQTSG